MSLQERFKSWYNNVPDVLLNASEPEENWLSRDIGFFVKLYLSGKGYIRFDMRASAKLQEDYWSAADNRPCGVDDMKIVGTVRCRNGEASHIGRSNHDRYSPMFVTIIHFIEKPKRMMPELIPSWVWQKTNDSLLGINGHRSNSSVSYLHDSFSDGELNHSLLFFRQRGRTRDGQIKRKVVQAIPQTVDGVTNGEGDFPRDFLQHFCEKFRTPLTIGLLNNSVAFVGNPCENQSFTLHNVMFGSKEFKFVTSNHILAITSRVRRGY